MNFVQATDMFLTIHALATDPTLSDLYSIQMISVTIKQNIYVIKEVFLLFFLRLQTIKHLCGDLRQADHS